MGTKVIEVCKSCGSKKEWTRVCLDCGKEFCTSCGNDDLMGPATCPKCQSENVKLN